MSTKKQVAQHSNSELTPNKLRSYTGFEHFTDEQAGVAIQNIKKLAKILFSIYENNTTSENPIK